jgi:hypothetical protein
MPRKTKRPEDTEAKISEVMSLMAQRSVEARRKAWGAREFKKRMKEWGKLGGRPKKNETDSKQRKEKP